MREDNYYSGKTYIWTYDKGGNILTKSEYAYTTGTPGEPLSTVNYSYGNSDWKDLLTEYNGTVINYDLSGNPLNWRNASSLTWDGRRLSGMTLTDGTELAFEYNADGLRTSKTVGNSTVQYVWNDGNLVAELRDGYTLKFLYNNGEAAGFSYNGADYYYGKDSFGVIRYLYNTSGEVVTTYTYDAWGTVLSVTGTLAETVGTVNPVRYKSYYLDSETGWYYLQSRYFDSEMGRFLNADDVKYINETNSIISCNLFSYCLNNPANMHDLYGNIAVSAAIAMSAQSLAKLAVVMILTLYVVDDDFRDNVNGMLDAIFATLINGAGYLVNVINDVIKNARRGRKYNWNEVHHIVAKKDPRAIFSRNILKRYSINVNDAVNLVVIKNSLHRYLHTSAYHFSVNMYLKISEWKGRSFSSKKQNVCAALLTISVLLQVANMQV